MKEAWGQNTRAVQLPGFSGGSSSYRLGGFCLNYCREYSGYVDDFGLCGNDGRVVNGWAHNNCPNVRYEDSCAGSILREYSCDGTQTNPSTTWADGVNYLLTTTDCYSPGGPATCDNSCGTSSNSGTDTCRLGDGGGYCTGTGLNARCESGGSSPDLDDGESYVTEFNNECSSGGGWTGSVDWANGGSIGYYGEYNNELYWKEAIIYDEGGIFIFGQNDTSDRGDFETEACGDDENEFFIGGLCCDDSNDQILSNVIDNIDDIFDMNGSYCMDANIGSCGNLVKDSWEQCDGLYIDYNRTILAGSNMATTSELYLVLGNDSACGGDICDLNTCTCSGSPPINCQLGNAHWGPTKSNDNVVEGETIDLIIDGTDCDGLGVEFFVKESDGVFGVQDWDSADWVLIYGNSPIGSATFEGNKANFTWTSVWTDDDDSWDSDPEYIFRAISTSDSSLYKNSFDELKVSQNPAGDCEIDLGEECCIAGEVCSGGNWDGSGAICSAGESCCLTVCSNPLDYPGSIDGTYMGWGECIDDGDGDSVGIRKTYLYNSTTGILINEIGSEECIFGEEEIPFFSNFAMFLVFFILIGFYFWNRKK